MDYYNQYYYILAKNNTQLPKVRKTQVNIQEDIQPAHVTVWMAWSNRVGPIVVHLGNLLSTHTSGIYNRKFNGSPY